MNEEPFTFRFPLSAFRFFFPLLSIVSLFCSVPASANDNLEAVASLLELVIDVDAEAAKKCLATLSSKIQTGEVAAEQLRVLQQRLDPALGKLLAQPEHPLQIDAALVLALWKNESATKLLRQRFGDTTALAEVRLRCLEALLLTGDADLLAAVETALDDVSPASRAFREQLLAALGRANDPRVAEVVLQHYAKLEPELQPKAIELLTQRPAWSAALITAVEQKKLSSAVLNASQLLKLQASADAAMKKKLVAIWGNVRTERNPQREQVVAEMRTLLNNTRGDAVRGQAVFQKVCGQCHKLHGQGQEVGPDLTSNGRASFEQLLSNVFDPSLVIGPAYQARVVVTDDGRILTGLIAEENEQRIVLKLQGGKVETIARSQVEEVNVSPLSLMPEGLEKQLTPEELADLFALITLDLPPSDPQAKLIPGTPAR